MKCLMYYWGNIKHSHNKMPNIETIIQDIKEIKTKYIQEKESPNANINEFYEYLKLNIEIRYKRRIDYPMIKHDRDEGFNN